MKSSPLIPDAEKYTPNPYGGNSIRQQEKEGLSLINRSESPEDVVVVEPGPFTTELFPQAPKPADEEGRAQTYPDVVAQTFEGLGSAFEGMFADPEVPTDPILVVEKFVELVDMTPGTRPFRSVVGVDLGVGERNKADEAFDGPFLEAMGLQAFVKLKT